MYDKSDSKPVTWTFAGLVLAALVVIVLLRHAYGIVQIEAGTR